MNAEQSRLKDTSWKKWGPYVSDRQWGTVREDYSANGDAWNYITHDMARSKTYRWGEEGIAGICDRQQNLCFAIALWNKKDPIIKERYFGLSNPEGNHGEDVKEIYYYLDSTPTHSYMKALYKYPQQTFPYEWLLAENKRRTRKDPEFELIDTGIFDNDAYFDVFTEYAKSAQDDILIKITIHNRGNEDAALNVMPTLWFRNTWSWGYNDYKPYLAANGEGRIEVSHKDLDQLWLHTEGANALLFCDNETNSNRLYNYDNGIKYHKDGINDHIVHGADTVNPRNTGTKAAVNYDVTVAAKQSVTIRLRLSPDANYSFEDFDHIFTTRITEADQFYKDIYSNKQDIDRSLIQRQAFAGMMWNKQFYYCDIRHWLRGDPAQPAPPPQRKDARNSKWMHLNTRDVISMPDKWEYPWFAAWDLAFHCLALARIDMAFAKNQLILLTRDWYMHPNGQLPAYEWDFGDGNPPVHAMVAWSIYKTDKEANNGKGDTYFLERIFHKLMLNFTWWVNRKDASGNNVFEGGFLGLDNIGVFDRNMHLPSGQHLEQADGTSWMAMYSLNLLRIATELAVGDNAYADIASKFFEHFIYIVGAMSNLGENNEGLWDEEDGFFYDQISFPDDGSIKMKVRSIVGLIPLFATEVLNESDITDSPIFRDRMKWFAENRPDLASLVSRWNEKSANGKHLISLLRGFRMKSILKYMLDEKEFLSDFGIRSLSKYHLDKPFHVAVNGVDFGIGYTPAESDSGLFGGNSNWRGPIWIPINYLIIDSLHRFYEYYGDDFKVECPTGSGNYVNLKEVANELYRRVSKLFLRDENGNRPVFGQYHKMQTDPNFKDYIFFYEYFDGDNGRGAGASHQTGWTGLIANCLYI
ncbi:Glycosyl hydrolase family 63 C-terminal domain-containing protein [Mucilaginibacter sp. OK268]|uniref:MGH1-like glycoside hydrolase domain-containing protein n=1 Tax=Mucilaginibacter sp. OK268 TaxID=1881048 RepID=UPI00089217C3|nr:glucosidase [Mucilaginibacter sp. OK268]SDP70574.1 Glycosyl hydrolase family 63 C-terminal domain-containing protein [Mucilaginibacter sp. OK268]